MVRVQALRGYPELVRDLGGRPNRLLGKAGIEPAAINQLTAFISFETLIDLLERSADDLGCADFGLRLAERQDIGILGTLAMAMRHSATVGDAVSCGSKYLAVHNAALAFINRPDQHPSRVALEFEVLDAHAPQWGQTAEHGVGLTWRIMTLLSEGRCRLFEVWFPHRQAGSTESYGARFDAPVTFRADHPALIVAARDLDLAISERNQELHDVATDYLASQLVREHPSSTAQVRDAIEMHLGTGTCSHRQVASALHVSPRTLQRRLHEEGTTFEVLKDETRRDLAQRYLSQPDCPAHPGLRVPRLQRAVGVGKELSAVVQCSAPWRSRSSDRGPCRLAILDGAAALKHGAQLPDGSSISRSHGEWPRPEPR